MKVVAYNSPSGRMIVAGETKRDICVALNISEREYKMFCKETKNADEVVKASESPGKVWAVRRVDQLIQFVEAVR